MECPPGGPAEIVDEDEFDASSVPPDEKALTRATAQWVAEAIDGASGPFGSAFRDHSDSLHGNWDKPTAHGAILTLQTWDEPAVTAAFGGDVLDTWRDRHTRREGYVLVAMTSGEVVGLGWKPHATGSTPDPQMIAVAERVRGSGLARELERAVQGFGPWGDCLSPPS